MTHLNRRALAGLLMLAATAAGAQSSTLKASSGVLMAPPGARLDASCSRVAGVSVYSLDVNFPHVTTIRDSLMALPADRREKANRDEHAIPRPIPADVQKAMTDVERFYRSKGFTWGSLMPDAVGGDSGDGRTSVAMIAANWILLNECKSLASGPVLMVFQRSADSK